jgi:hypothetical protein
VVEASRWAANTGLLICGLEQGTIDPFRALAGYTSRLDAPPPPPLSVDDEIGFQAGVRYFDRQQRGSDAAVRYYWETLLPTIIARSRRKLAAHNSGDRGEAFAPTHLVTIISSSPELVPLMAEVLESVTDVLLLYTLDEKPAQGKIGPEAIRDRLAQVGKRCQLADFRDDATQAEAIPALIREFLSPVSPGQAIYDITPGTGWMRWLADRAMPPGSWRVYLRHESKTAGSRPRIGTEDPIPWRV